MAPLPGGGRRVHELTGRGAVTAGSSSRRRRLGPACTHGLTAVLDRARAAGVPTELVTQLEATWEDLRDAELE